MCASYYIYSNTHKRMFCFCESKLLKQSRERYGSQGLGAAIGGKMASETSGRSSARMKVYHWKLNSLSVSAAYPPWVLVLSVSTFSSLVHYQRAWKVLMLLVVMFVYFQDSLNIIGCRSIIPFAAGTVKRWLESSQKKKVIRVTGDLPHHPKLTRCFLQPCLDGSFFSNDFIGVHVWFFFLSVQLRKACTS